MSGGDVSTLRANKTSVLRKIGREINLAEYLLIEYLKEVSGNIQVESPAEKTALENLADLVVKELEYLKKVKRSEIVNVTGNLVTFRSNEGEFLVTVVPEEELRRNFHPFFCFNNIKPRFAKPVVSREKFATPSASAESVYYDAFYDLPSEVPEVPPATSAFGRSIHSLLNYIFASTIGRMESSSDRSYS